VFALENGAPGLVDVTGVSLFDFITGAETRQVYRQLLSRVRQGERVAFPFRCDSHEMVREMSMIICPLDHGRVRFESFLLKATPRLVLPSAGMPARIRVCSWCKRILWRGEWQYPEFAIEAMKLFDPLHSPVILHEICEECSALLSVARPEARGTNHFD